jgi:molybdopterin converting factor subunit 1
VICSVKLFAVARERIGQSVIQVELPAGASAAQLRSALAAQFPDLSSLLPHSRLAINNDYATDSTPLAPTAEIALIPPVSGG